MKLIKPNKKYAESYEILTKESERLGINFVGNVEGRDAFSGKIDAIVCDGFTGNILMSRIHILRWHP